MVLVGHSDMAVTAGGLVAGAGIRKERRSNHSSQPLFM